MVLSIRTSIAYEGNLFVGECSSKSLKKLDLSAFLGYEMIARASLEERLELARASFVFLAKAHNDAAATDAFSMAFSLCSPTAHKSPFDLRITPNEYRAKIRSEHDAFFQWLISAYWSLPLYVPSQWEDRTTDDHGFDLGDVLPLTKTAVYKRVAEIWSGRSVEDGTQAFAFLCDCFDSRRFTKKTPHILDAINSYKGRNFYSRLGTDNLVNVSSKDQERILSALREAMPKDIELIKSWGRYAKAHAPPKLAEIFMHAYVKAGGDVFG